MKRAAPFILVFSLFALAGVIAWPAWRIATAWNSGTRAAALGFAELRRNATRILADSPEKGVLEWELAARSLWASDSSIMAIVIRDSAGDVLYALPATSPYYRPAETARGLSSQELFLIPGGSIRRYSASLAGGMSIDALYTVISQRSLALPIRDALIGLGGLLLLSFSFLLIHRFSQGKARALSYSIKSHPSAPAFRAAAHAPFPMANDAPDSDDGFSIPDYYPDYDEGLSKDSEPDESPEEAVRPVQILSGNVAPQELGERMGSPTGLFNPDTGLCWESYLRERLDAELKRSASFEQDLSLLIASLDKSERGTEEFSLFARTVQEFFSFKDLSFEMGPAGIAVILPNMDIDHAIRMSEELLKKLTFLLQGRSDDMSYLELFMGLSSRSGRLVEADRMVSESMAALRKAREERDTRIMAFRPDPEKFRAFLASR